MELVKEVKSMLILHSEIPFGNFEKPVKKLFIPEIFCLSKRKTTNTFQPKLS